MSGWYSRILLAFTFFGAGFLHCGPANNYGSLSFHIAWIGDPSRPAASRPAGCNTFHPTALPTGVVSLRVEVTGPNMGNKSQKFSDLTPDGGSIVVTGVPAGTDRTITLEGLDAGDTALFRGTASGITVVADQNNECGTILMKPYGELAAQIQSIVDQGKSQLADYDYRGATETFWTVLDDYDDRNSEAMFGAVLAIILETLSTLDDKFDASLGPFFEMVGGGGASPPSPFSPQAKSGLNLLVESLVDQMIMDAIETINPLLDGLKLDSEFNMVIESAPLLVGAEDSILSNADIGGEFDLGDVYLLSALVRYLQGNIKILYATDLTLNPPTIYGLLGTYFPALTGETSITLDRRFYTKLVAFVLNTSPNFLALEPTYGKESLASAAEDFIQANDDLFDCLEFIKDETDDQTDDFVAYQVKGEKQYMTLQYQSGEGLFTQVPVEFSNDVFLAFEHQIASTQAAGGVRVNFVNDLVPFQALLFQGMGQAGMFTAIADFALPMLEEYVGSETVEMARGAFDTLTEMASGGILAGGYTLWIPNVLEIDFGKLYHDPPEELWRLLLPVLETGQDGVLDLVYEYECPETLRPIDAMCRFPEGITSSGHFSGEHSIKDDGIDSPLPYYICPDPTLDGIVYLNLHPLDPNEFSDEFHLPSLYEYNYFFAGVIGQLLSGFGIQ